MHPVLALFRRNAWATERLLEFCAGRPEVAASAEKDVYGGIEPLFNHIVRGETGYLRRVTAEHPEDPVREEAPRALSGLREPNRWLAGRWLSALDADRDPEVMLPRQRGDEVELMADWVPLVQCVHHGDDHRTQVATLLSRHGLEPPLLDGWVYSREPVAKSDLAARDWWAALLARFLGHHRWANERLLEHCRALSPDQLAFSAPGTYGSIEATLDHLVSSDQSYLSSLKAPGWQQYLESGPDFEAIVERRGRQAPAWAVVLQAIHHGNDHRTHVGTVLLANELPPPEIDVWSYGLAEGALKSPG